MSTRRTGLALVLLAGALAAGSTFAPWVDFEGFTLALWDITNLEAVVLAASGFAAIALAALGLRRGGRETESAVVGAFVAALALSLADDVWGDHGGVGAWIAVAATAPGLTGAGILTGGQRRRMLAAVAAVAAGILVGDVLFDVHPEVQVIR